MFKNTTFRFPEIKTFQYWTIYTKNPLHFFKASLSILHFIFTSFLCHIAMYVSFCHNKNLQVIIIHMKIDAIQYINIKAKNVKGKHPPITVGGIALNGQADLISIFIIYYILS